MEHTVGTVKYEPAMNICVDSYGYKSYSKLKTF